MQEQDVSFPDFFPPQKICIIGAGRFGYLAAQRLSERYPLGSFVVIDKRKDKLARIEQAFGLPVETQDILSCLENAGIDDNTWIIPAVPLHFAFQWVFHELAKTGYVEHLPVPAEVEPQIPNPYRGSTGSICASFATFICPDYCNEPDEICTYTGRSRSGDLFNVLGRITIPGFHVIVIRSWQLAPGVGGYPKSSLMKALEEIKNQPERSYLMVTSCRCHGVIDGLRWERTHND